ncbi:biotin--acetyl-CoA-carboxylase ligase [Bacillus coahuilensis m2-6]|uniref:biotin--[acetyl-CoA-carboxylase] ligase n=1 Tax=Bacillus coahuilensis TaxID=408580 RepID=UPI000750318B|nr:biotin--[acetyl-CoA-carboxylase] ligase [Bacillus coahuilensis]KUP08037.1 biotin--acetyl-CoA-carboxylase ligase [Bacillus coahuilensis m2-6]
MESTIKSTLVQSLGESNGEFVSGQRIAEIMGCSRTAVWKHIEELRQEGYVVEAVRKKGYRIMSSPDTVSAIEIQNGLKTKKLGQHIIHYDTIDSTQKIAHQLVQEGAPEGTMVISEEQTIGRGRLTRNWYSPKYTGIWMSIILRPNLPPVKAPQFTLITAVAVAKAITEVTGLEAEIKWPNDILIQGRKVTGILTELVAESDRINAIIIGIGMNVNQTVEDFPEELKTVATSLLIEGNEPSKRSELVKEILIGLEKYYALYMTEGFYPIKLLWESYAISIGKQVIARTFNETIEGTALGITDDGVLRLQDKNNRIHKIYSADIEMK